MPVGVVSGHHDEYLNDCPGSRTGCAPTTPGPRNVQLGFKYYF